MPFDAYLSFSFFFFFLFLFLSGLYFMFYSFLFFPNIFVCRTRILLAKFLSVACVGGQARLFSI